MTSYELLFGVPPSYDELRVFGCRCFPNMIATSAHKLATCSTPCVFIGYPTDHHGYRCYSINTSHVITSWHVIFDEDVFPFHDIAPSRPASHVSSSTAPPNDDAPSHLVANLP
jgi:histone deacetylase 1/2